MDILLLLTKSLAPLVLYSENLGHHVPGEYKSWLLYLQKEKKVL